MATAPSWTLWLLMCRVADGMIAQEAAAAATTFGYKLEINRGNAMGVGSPPLWPRCGHSCGQIEVASNAYDCARLVKSKDTSPKRSPQIVHTLLAWYFQGKDVVEGGTRFGDGLDCWVRGTNSTVGMEIDLGYCRAMRARGQAAGYKAKLTMHCRSFYVNTPDADVYTFWAQRPEFVATTALQHLARVFAAGQLRRNAEAVVLLEKGNDDDDDEFACWARKYASWSIVVPYDELADCKARSTARSQHLCRRARGLFRVMVVPLRAIPANVSCEQNAAGGPRLGSAENPGRWVLARRRAKLAEDARNGTATQRAR